MGRKPLTEEQYAEKRERILDAARKIFVSEGIEEVTIRRVASQVGISAMTIYKYYDDKQALVMALVRYGLGLLKKELQSALEISDGNERLLALGDAYLAFAAKHPKYYHILFVTPLTQSSVEEYSRLFGEVAETMRPLVQTVAEITGDFGSAVERAIVTWCVLHGFGSLSTTNRLQIMGASPEHIQGLLKKWVPQMLKL